MNLFILAHPDDEIAFAPIIHRLVGKRAPVRLVYLTDGSSGGPPAVREAETVRALAWLGVAASQLRFAGHEIGIPDGQLHCNLGRALEAIEQWCETSPSIDCIYTLAWEGGHPDHDAAHIVAAAFAAARGVDSRVRQIPFYRASDNWPAPIFTVGSPLPANGPVVGVALSPGERWLPVRMIPFYRSQWRSFAGLAPLMLWHALTRGSFSMQDLSKPRLADRPTARPLLYEVRNGVRCEDFLAASAAFLALHQPARRTDPAPVAAPEVLTA
ncbi:MAG: PIG-L family deacetylase [Sphingomicrobium sp.]